MNFNIITFHDALNHGAVLQAYALQQFIESLGFDAGIYDYRSYGTESFRGRLIRYSRLLYRKAYEEKKKRFRDFTEEKLRLNTDRAPQVFFTGSDQVWNPSGLMDPAYFLQSADPRCIKASYAASLGVPRIPEDKKKLFSEYLESLDAVSVRETPAKEEIGKLYSGEILVHMDPVFLMDREFWQQETRSVEGIPDKYILVYALKKTGNLDHLIRWLKKETGLAVVMIDEQGYLAGQVRHDRAVRNAGPREFLWLVANAHAVISTSFHGAAFSVLFHKELYALADPDKPARIEQLAELFGVPVIHGEKTFRRMDAVDFAKADRVLHEEREKAEKYIRMLYHMARERARDHRNIRSARQYCTGCGSCKAVCPVHAVDRGEDPEGGFWIPEVREDLCLSCGKCLKICPAQEEHPRYPKPRKAFGAWHRDPKVLRTSTSGGVFRGLADLVLQEGGCVIGARYSEDCRSVCYASSDECGIEELQGSKYAAPDPAGAVEKAMEALLQGRKVLFSGPPCHVAGLKNMAGVQENLWTCDFICRGMPAPAAFREHLDMLEAKEKSQIRKVAFRSKINGWNVSKAYYWFASGKILNVRKAFRDTFYNCFTLAHVNVRECCTRCSFFEAHPADVTMGDFWSFREFGVKKNRNGMSLVLVNTEKGERLLKALESRMELRPLPLRAAADALRRPDAEEENQRTRNSYFSIARRAGYEAAARKFITAGYLPQVLLKLRSTGRSIICRNSAARHF